jgi:pyruvate-formate lyase-activating enzyme
MDKPWRVVSNADGVDEEYAALKEALAEADKVLTLWREQANDEGEWDEDVEGVEVHLVTHAARITMREGDNEGDGVEYGITEILGNEVDEEIRRLNSALTSSKEEVERLFQDAVQTQRHADRLLEKLHTAETALEMERKETEMLRELITKWTENDKLMCAPGSMAWRAYDGRLQQLAALKPE